MNTLEIYYEKGWKEGYEKGYAAGLQIELEIWKKKLVSNLLATNRCSISEIAGIVRMSEAAVKKISLSSKRKK